MPEVGKTDQGDCGLGGRKESDFKLLDGLDLES